MGVSHGCTTELELSAALTALKGTAWSLVMMSAMLNIIYLTGSFFMLEVYDRVIPSKSLPTLIGLCIIAAVLYMGQACPRPDTQPHL